jgi:hypothetical protein
MVYICYYNCPHCPSTCDGKDPSAEANELVECRTKTRAREMFNQGKCCRHMQLLRIEEYHPELAHIKGVKA